MAKAKQKKIRTSAQVDQQFIGGEPTWDKNSIGLIRSLSWYANQCGPKESKKFTLDYVKKNNFKKEIQEKLSKVSDDFFLNLGFVCRIIEKGAPLEKKEWINERINYIIKNHLEIQEEQEKPQEKEEKVTIQDRIFDQCTTFISEIDGFVDDWIRTKKPVSFNAYEWMVSNLVKGVHAKQISDYYKKLLSELEMAYNKEDEQLVEGYSSFKRTELKGFIGFVKSIVEDCDKIINNAKVTKKPRKKKAIPLAKKVAKLNYKKEDNEYKLASINPVEIIGAKQLWVFNTKTKKLGLYTSIDDSGLSIKGSSIEGYNDINSVQKTLRKPLDTLSLVIKGKKSELNKLLSTINGKSYPLNGRVNNETILIKVIK